MKKKLPIPNLQYAVNLIRKLFVMRIKSMVSEDSSEIDFLSIQFSRWGNEDTEFWKFIKKNNLTVEELVVLTLALIPHFDPAFLGKIIAENLSASGDFPEIGGIKSDNNRYFLPTGETAIFLLSGNDFASKTRLKRLFSHEHFFYKKGILYLEKVKSGIPKTTGRLILDDEYVELFLFEKNSLPTLSTNFPATHLRTQQKWNDLILPKKTLQQIKEIKIWLDHHDTLMHDWGMKKKLKPGFRALFHGPSGTGKTMTATLLGKLTGLEVFKIDLSMVVSKFIGETEKNLATLFNKAESKNWILFFDEADALFGKRTSVRDAHDKYANQEVAYLLQRIENYDGLVILASNFKANIDTAFTRRFQSIISFSMPQAAERLQIWNNAFPENINFAKEVNLDEIAETYELSGSNILNVVQFACLKALAKNSHLIRQDDLLKGIQKEYEKEGKLF